MYCLIKQSLIDIKALGKRIWIDCKKKSSPVHKAPTNAGSKEDRTTLDLLYTVLPYIEEAISTT